MNDIQKQKGFQERIKERVRDSIGELMTDAELSRIVERCTEDIFFKPTEVKDGWRTVTRPPLLHDIVKKLLFERVSVAVENYIKENADVVKNAIKSAIEQGMGKALLNAVTNRFTNQLFELQRNIEDSLQNTKSAL